MEAFDLYSDLERRFTKGNFEGRTSSWTMGLHQMLWPEGGRGGARWEEQRPVTEGSPLKVWEKPEKEMSPMERMNRQIAQAENNREKISELNRTLASQDARIKEMQKPSHVFTVMTGGGQAFIDATDNLERLAKREILIAQQARAKTAKEKADLERQQVDLDRDISKAMLKEIQDRAKETAEKYMAVEAPFARTAEEKAQLRLRAFELSPVWKDPAYQKASTEQRAIMDKEWLDQQKKLRQDVTNTQRERRISEFESGQQDVTNEFIWRARKRFEMSGVPGREGLEGAVGEVSGYRDLRERRTAQLSGLAKQREGLEVMVGGGFAAFPGGVAGALALRAAQEQILSIREKEAAVVALMNSDSKSAKRAETEVLHEQVKLIQDQMKERERARDKMMGMSDVDLIQTINTAKAMREGTFKPVDLTTALLSGEAGRGQLSRIGSAVGGNFYDQASWARASQTTAIPLEQQLANFYANHPISMDFGPIQPPIEAMSTKLDVLFEIRDILRAGQPPPQEVGAAYGGKLNVVGRVR
jgi:hypothetical protein